MEIIWERILHKKLTLLLINRLRSKRMIMVRLICFKKLSWMTLKGFLDRMINRLIRLIYLEVFRANKLLIFLGIIRINSHRLLVFLIRLKKSQLLLLVFLIIISKVSYLLRLQKKIILTYLDKIWISKQNYLR